MTISTGTMAYESERQRASVDDRGAGFGDIYLFDTSGEVEVRFCWAGNGHVWAHGYATPTPVQKARAVRALAETEVGRRALRLPEHYDPSILPSADEEERSALRAAAEAAGLLPPEGAPAAEEAPTKEVSVVTTAREGGVKVEVHVTVER